MWLVTAFMWFMGISALVVIVLWFIGTVMIGDNETKAARYLADKYDREHK